MTKLTDSYGRNIDYLRISVTDRCNLRCVYCMPPEGVKWKPHQDILTFEEILRITRLMSKHGVQNIKVTGGEPLLRRGTASFLKELKTIPEIKRVTLTTNGLLLASYLDEVKAMGAESFLPDSINISLDALDAERSKQITRCYTADPKTILPIIDSLLEKQITVKINCVPIRSVNEEEIIPLAALAKDKNIIVRFIELMPIGCASALHSVPVKETASRIEKTFGALSPLDGIYGSGPAVYYSLPGFAGKIGFINAVTHGFCETCNRLRLTSEGFLKLCLSSDLGLNLRELIRSGVNDAELACAIAETVKNKPRLHSFSKSDGAAHSHSESMSKIGG